MMNSSEKLVFLYYRCIVLRQSSLNIESFILTVQSEQEVFDYCQRRQFALIKYNQLSRYSVRYLWHSISQSRLSSQALIHFCDYLAHVLESGITLLDALEEFSLHHQSLEFKQILYRIIDDLRYGYKISDAFAKYPHLFDSAFIGLLHTAEQTGQLSDIFHQLGHHLKWQFDLIQKTKQALTYPIITLIIMLATLLFLLGYTVPQLVDFIKSIDGEISWNTQLLIWVGDFIHHYYGIIFVMPLLIIFTISFIKWRYAYYFESYLFKIPLLGSIYHHVLLARTSYLLHLLYKSGIPFLESLTIVKSSITHCVIQNQLTKISEHLKNGKPITESFTKESFFHPLLIPLISMGENTGKLDHALSAISQFYIKDVDTKTTKIYTLAQPILTVMLGIILIWIISSVIAPIYDLILKI